MLPMLLATELAADEAAEADDDAADDDADDEAEDEDEDEEFDEFDEFEEFDDDSLSDELLVSLLFFSDEDLRDKSLNLRSSNVSGDL